MISTLIAELKEYARSSVICRALHRATQRMSAFFASGSIWRWMTGAGVKEPGRADRWLHRLVESPLGDFIRSSKLLGWLISIPEICQIALMLTLLSALCLPTLLVMALALLTLGLTVIGIFFRKEILPPLAGGLGPWALFFLLTVIYTFVGYGGLRGMLAGGIRVCLLPLLPCAWILLRGKRIRRFLYAFGGGVIGIGLYGIYQFLTGAMSNIWTDTNLFDEGFGRLTSTFENPNVYGTFLLFAVPLTLVGAVFEKKWSGRLFFIGACVIASVNLALTYSRGCYVSIVLILMILLICRGRSWLWVGAGAVAACPLYLPQNVLDRVISIGNLGDSSVAYRIHIWQGVWEMLKKYWWLGVGIGDDAFEAVYDGSALTGIEAPHAHNLMMQITCEYGVLGLVVLVAMFVLLFRTAMSAVGRDTGRARWLRIALLSCWIGLLVQGVTDYIFYNNNLFAIMMIMLGAMICNLSEGVRASE